MLTEEVKNNLRILDDQVITVDLTPCSEHCDENHSTHGHRFARGFNQNLDVYSSGKKSVPSLLTSNDKYSVGEKRSSRKSSIISEKNETGKFGGTIGSGVSAFNEVSLKAEYAKENAHNEGTFGNVSFGEAELCDLQ